MIDAKQEIIKERILKFAMDQWGVKNPRDMDPVVDLLLDVFAYETSKLHEDINSSDSALLHRLAGILIDRKWTLPLPSHALLSVNPNPEDTCILNSEDHFYAEKFVYGKDEMQVFFTPLFPTPLVDAKIDVAVTADMVRCNVSDKLENQFHIQSGVCSRLNSNTVWVALNISESQLENIDKLTLCLLPEDWSILPYLRISKFFDSDGTLLESRNGIRAEDPFGNAQYFNDIKNYYSDLYFELDLKNSNKVKCSIKDLLQDLEIEDDCSIVETQYLWIRIVLPSILEVAHLNKIKVLVNTVPVVNRKLVSQQHNFKTNGNIIPLYTDEESQLLNVRCVQDDNGNEYPDRLNQLEISTEGVFSLYFGNLERFDSTNAKSQIIKLLQLIKEEGNAFAAIDSDALTTHLKNLFERIQSIEKIVSASTDERNLIKSFALTVPYRDATYAEIRYWITIGEMANGIQRNTSLQQFNMDKYDGSSIIFRTASTGGRSTFNESSFADSLRYGLLTRERIVSKEDIRCFITHKLGRRINNVTIKDGVALSPERKKGLIRITEIYIEPDRAFHLENTEAAALGHVIEKELSQRSIAGTTYRVYVK